MYGYVYITTNLINGKRYIGQHKSKVFDASYLGSGTILKRAFDKYGKENFKCEILEWCETFDILNEKEKYYIKFYNADISPDFYNICIGGYNSRGRRGKNNPMYGKPSWNKGVPMSEETKKRLSESKTNKYKGLNSPLYGTHRTEETKRKIGENRKGKYAGKNNPNYGNHKLQGGKHPKAKKIYCKNLDITFDCIKDAAEYLGICVDTIRKYANLKQPYEGNIFEFIKED